MCNLCHATELLHMADFRQQTLKRFVAICTTLPRQLWRHEVRKSLGISTPRFLGVQMEVLVEKREEFLTAAYVVFEKLCPLVTQVRTICAN